MFTTNTYLQGILFSIGLGLATCCDDYEMEQCLYSFKSKVGTEPLKTEQQITTVCNSHYPILRSYLSPYVGGCDLQGVLEGVTKLYEYVCNEGKEGAVRYAECLSKTSLLSDLESCASTMNSTLRSNTRADKETKCGPVDVYLDCATDAAEAECGIEVAEHQTKLWHLMKGSVLETIGCGCSSISAMLWIIGVVLIFQWLVR